MANKTLRTRPKLVFRAGPAGLGNALKPRNPFSVAAGQRAAGPHRKSGSALRQAHKRTLKKAAGEPDDGES